MQYKTNKPLLLLTCLLITFLEIQAQNKLPLSSWASNIGPVDVVAGFSANGGSQQNSIIWDTDPSGKKAIIWKAVCDGTAAANGGWDIGSIPVSANKAYRATVWIKRTTTSPNGYIYLGCDGTSTLFLNGSVHTNPYFLYINKSSLVINKWYLWVGYIHASNDPDMNSYGGVYDGETGQKVFSCTDYKLKPDAVTQVHRTYNYYDGTMGSTVYWYAPRFEEINGDEPSVEQLLGTVGKSATLSKNAFLGGAVGIGTVNPAYKFVVSNQEGNGFEVDPASTYGTRLLSFNRSASYYTQLSFNANNYSFTTGNVDDAINITQGGSMGIGVVDPGNYKLAVNGEIKAKKLTISQLGWSDYVFHPDYKLRSLDQVDAFIKKNNHLPDMPSAKEVEAKGISVGDTQALLLKKIEELTLYILDQQKQINELKKKIEKK